MTTKKPVVVYAALAANVGIAIAKFAAAALSGSSAMLAEAIHSGMTFKTVIGSFAYDAKGDRKDADYVMYTWKKGADGKITYVQN